MREQLLCDVEVLIPSLRRYARFLVRDAHASDDLVQDCLERAVRHLDRFQEGTNLRAWLLTIMRNCFFDGTRKAKRNTEVAFDEALGTTVCSPARQEDNVLLSELREAFVSLPDHQKLAMICVVFEGLSYEEAAAALGVAVGTVKSRVARGRETLRGATVEPLRKSA